MNADIFVPLAGMVTGIILGFPLIRAVVNVIERKGQSGSGPELERLRQEVKELRSKVEEASEVHDRLLDLEERIDFTERLLTQQRNDSKLPG